MTIIQFDKLSTLDKHDMVLECGTFLLYRHCDEFTRLLFQLDSFYVELYYHKLNERFLHFRVLESVDELEPYLQQIPVSLEEIFPGQDAASQN